MGGRGRERRGARRAPRPRADEHRTRGLQRAAGRRRRGDGQPWLPFFLQRAAGVADPGAAGDAGAIAWIELAGDAERLRAWLGGEELPVRYAEGGPPGVRAVGLGAGAVIR
jgi:hypothetical protein